jgi:hypothetical protein
MNTRNKGALAEYRFISYAISLDLRVLAPAVEGYPYDCVIDNGTSFYKIQVKYASKDKRAKKTFSSMLQRKVSGPNSVFKNYTAKEVDYFALYIWYIDTFFIIPFDAIEGNSINLNLANDKNKFTQYKNNWKQLLR